MKSYEVQILRKSRTSNGTKYHDLLTYKFDDLKEANDFAKKTYYDSDGDAEVILLEVIRQEILIEGL